MNYVSKENAIALKELGFDATTRTFYFYHSDELKSDSIRANYNSESFNRYSAPDFLTAADWLNKITGDSIRISFLTCITLAISSDNRQKFEHGDHRNAAITYAINQIKNLKSNETQS